jgi:hypothetical protein
VRKLESMLLIDDKHTIIHRTKNNEYNSDVCKVIDLYKGLVIPDLKRERATKRGWNVLQN